MKVLLCMDGSSLSQVVAEAATARQWPEGTVLKLVSVVDSSIPTTAQMLGSSIPAPAADPHSMLKTLAESLQTAIPNVKVDVEVLSGRVREALLDHCSQWHSDLVIAGSHGRTGLELLMLGSVSQALLNHADCPVLVARPGLSKAEINILVAVDHSKFSLRALEWLLKQRWKGTVNIRLLSVLRPIDPGFADESNPQRAAEKLARIQMVKGSAINMLNKFADAFNQSYPSGALHCDAVEGDPREVILQIAKTWPADLIVMGSHGRTGVTRFVLGSVSAAVSQIATCSVEVVRFPDLLDYVEHHRDEDRAKIQAEATGEFHPHVHFH
jgi:nucleotide-binding universal stress UspA family protein